MSSFLDEPVRGFLDQLAARTPTPGGGGAAAVTGAMAAGLVAMAARFSATRLPGAGELADQADELRRRLGQLAEEDAQAYAAVLEALRGPGEAGSGEQRETQWREALLGAAIVPLEIAEIGAQVALMAARLAETGNPNLRGDAITGVLLAEAGARAAAVLVWINLAVAPDDDRPARAARLVAEAASIAAATQGSSGQLRLPRAAATVATAAATTASRRCVCAPRQYTWRHAGQRANAW